MILKDKRILVTGGTGSVGKVLVKRLLSGEMDLPRTITVFSRDEAKQHAMRLAFHQLRASTEEIIFRNFERLLQFRIGDVRDLHSISTALGTAMWFSTRPRSSRCHRASTFLTKRCKRILSGRKTSCARFVSTVCPSKRKMFLNRQAE